jgi:membrane protein implicated in regulation of membrane protease activity
MRALPILVWLMALIFVRGCWLTLLYAVEAVKMVVVAIVAVMSVIMAVVFYRTNRRNPHAMDFEGRKRAYEEGQHPTAP